MPQDGRNQRAAREIVAERTARKVFAARTLPRSAAAIGHAVLFPRAAFRA